MSDDKNDLTCAPQEHEFLVPVALPLFCPITHSSAALRGGFSSSRRQEQTWMTHTCSHTQTPPLAGDSCFQREILFGIPMTSLKGSVFLYCSCTQHPGDALQNTTGCKNSKIRLRDPRNSWLPQHVFAFNINSQA